MNIYVECRCILFYYYKHICDSLHLQQKCLTVLRQPKGLYGTNHALFIFCKNKNCKILQKKL